MKAISNMSNQELLDEINRLNEKAHNPQFAESHRKTCSNLADMLTRELKNRSRNKPPQ